MPQNGSLTRVHTQGREHKYCGRGRPSVFHWGLCVVFLFLTGGFPALAAGNSVYQVSGLPVAEVASSEQKAKTQGIARAKEQAFTLLLKRLIPVADHDQLPVVKLPELDNLILGLSISDEKMSHGAGRYLATVDVDFRPSAVRSLLQQHDLPYAETLSRPLLILPVLRSDGAALLWEEDNPWFQAWRNLPKVDGLVPLILPEGDLRDVANTQVQEILTGKDGGLGKLAVRYQTQGFVFVSAYRNPGLPGNSPAITVSVTVQAPGWEGFSWHRNFRGPPDLPGEELLDVAAEAVVSALEEGWKRKNLIDLSGEKQTLRAFAPLQTLRDWITLRQGLLQTAMISEVRLERLSVHRAEVQLRYLGSADQLKNALLQRDIVLRLGGEAEQWGDGGWILEQLRQDKG